MHVCTVTEIVLTTTIKLKVKKDHRSEFSNLSNWKKKPEKIRASTGFEPVTCALPVRCSTN